MAYTTSQAYAGRGTFLEAQYGSPLAFQIIAEIKKISFSGAKYDLADVTNMQSGNFREWLPTLADAGEVSFEGNDVSADPTQIELLALFNGAVLTVWNVVLPSGKGTISFNGYVSSIDRTYPVDKEATLSGKIKITGPITNFI